MQERRRHGPLRSLGAMDWGAAWAAGGGADDVQTGRQRAYPTSFRGGAGDLRQGPARLTYKRGGIVLLRPESESHGAEQLGGR
jgi:hypothetical protein